MIQYRVKGNDEQATIMEIIEKSNGGYHVMITRCFDDYQKQTREFLTDELFETCVRTGYLTALDAETSLMTA